VTKFFHSRWGPPICITVDLYIPIWGFLNDHLKWSYKGGSLALGTGAAHFPSHVSSASDENESGSLQLPVQMAHDRRIAKQTVTHLHCSLVQSSASPSNISKAYVAKSTKHNPSLEAPDLFIYLFIYLFVYLFVYVFIYVFICLFMYLFIYLCIYLFIYVFIYLFIYVFIYVFIYLFIYVFIYVFICLFMYSFMYLFFICLFIYLFFIYLFTC